MTGTRDRREVIRDEHGARLRILDLLAGGPRTVPELARALGYPDHEVVYWVMAMRKYGYLAVDGDATDGGYFRYRAVERRET